MLRPTPVDNFTAKYNNHFHRCQKVTKMGPKVHIHTNIFQMTLVLCLLYVFKCMLMCHKTTKIKCRIDTQRGMERIIINSFIIFSAKEIWTTEQCLLHNQFHVYILHYFFGFSSSDLYLRSRIMTSYKDLKETHKKMTIA